MLKLNKECTLLLTDYWRSHYINHKIINIQLLVSLLISFELYVATIVDNMKNRGHRILLTLASENGD